MKGETAIRRNTREFRMLRDAFDDYATKPSRTRSIILYSLRPGQPLSARVPLDNKRDPSNVLYNMQYESVQEYFRDRNKKLYWRRGTGLFYFKPTASSTWIELPFEIKGRIRKMVAPLFVVKSVEAAV
jgi:hypothetical protein